MKERTPKLLLHVCCGPCALTTIAAAKAEGLSPVGFFFNPNIHLLQEYLKRREGAGQEPHGLRVGRCTPGRRGSVAGSSPHLGQFSGLFCFPDAT